MSAQDKLKSLRVRFSRRASVTTLGVLLIGSTLNGCLLTQLQEALFGKEESNDDALFALLLLAAGGACPPYDWGLPADVPPPNVPRINCMSTERVELGRLLFYDKRLSGNQTMSCASCHLQSRAFTDGLARSVGSTGQTHARNSQQLSNVAYHASVTWMNPILQNLEMQALVPITSESDPPFTIIELGFGDMHLGRIRNDADYSNRFQAAYGVSGAQIQLDHIQRALASFQRSLLSFDSSYDRFVRGAGGLSPAAVRGASLFNGEVAECFHCHGGFNFSDSSSHTSETLQVAPFHNNGIYSADDYAAMGAGRLGLRDITGLATDEGKFRAPSLRNVGYSFPYMHDGSITCDAPHVGNREACARNALAKVLTHYMSGGKVDGGGNVHPNVDQTLIRPFTLTAQEQQDIVEFLMSLDDASFVSNSAFSNPRPSDPNFGP